MYRVHRHSSAQVAHGHPSLAILDNPHCHYQHNYHNYTVGSLYYNYVESKLSTSTLCFFYLFTRRNRTYQVEKQFMYSGLQRTCKLKKAINETAHVQYLKDQRKNWKGSLFAFLEVVRTLQTAVVRTCGKKRSKHVGKKKNQKEPHQKCRESVRGRQSRSTIKWPTPC